MNQEPAIMNKVKLRQGEYTVMGRPESGYSMKVRSALRYKGVPHQWMDRFSYEKLFQAHAKVQLIPLVFLPDGSTMQDSTPILERLESDHPERSLHPTEPALRFLSEVLEEYGDEWGNKLMFHYRWGYPADQKCRSNSLASGIIAGRSSAFFGKLLGPLMAPLIVKRMVPRMGFAGANDNNKPILIKSFANLVTLLEAHLQSHSYLFGERPALADFGLWGQLHQAYIDPSCCVILKAKGPAVVAWIERMLDPKALGDFNTLENLAPTLRPIFAQEVGPRFLAWDVSNAKAWEAGEPQTELAMDGQRYYQKTFKYPAQAFSILREKFEAANSNEPLNHFLEETGCLAYLNWSEKRSIGQIKGPL
jgi:glutathione S-transferase